VKQHTTSRREIMAGVRRLVVKVGSSLITETVDDRPRLSEERIRLLADAIRGLPEHVREVVVVSSGAIAAGRDRAGMGRPVSIPQKQALAAIGQGRLMQAWERVFSEAGRTVGQVLLTQEDFDDRRRFINARNTLFTLLSWGVVPVINENDTVAVDEIKLGDNDTLSALVTSLTEADLLLILSDVEGLYDADPRTTPDARLVREVRRIDPATLASAGGAGSCVGTGGMTTKLRAAAKVMDLGVPTVIAGGHVPRVIARVVAGEEVGTIFLPRKAKLPGRKHWIRHTLRPRGSIVVDRGGAAAVLQRGKSLLPAGIVSVQGEFRQGDAVRCLDLDGVEFARGLVNYGAREVEAIRGRRTDEIESVLGYKYYDEVIHRDDLVVVSAAGDAGGEGEG
jgi:glutamate 5-kinase